MGQAKRRGTFAERKEQAIARRKRQQPERVAEVPQRRAIRRPVGPELVTAMAATLAALTPFKR